MTPINLHPSTRELRQFGVVLIVGFSIIAGIVYYKGHASVAVWMAGTATGIGLFALVFPSLSKPFYWLWMGIGWAVGQVTSRLIMGIFFYGLLTPLAFFFRWTGRDVLQRRKRAAAHFS
jgi:polyferredoxin